MRGRRRGRQAMRERGIRGEGSWRSGRKRGGSCIWGLHVRDAAWQCGHMKVLGASTCVKSVES